MPLRSARRCAWVPLPDPGAPNRTMRMFYFSARPLHWQHEGGPRYRAPGARSNAARLTTPCAILSNTMKKTVRSNAFYAQSGGVSAVINASAAGVIETAMRSKHIGKVYAGRDGIVGALTEDLIDCSRESAATIR